MTIEQALKELKIDYPGTYTSEYTYEIDLPDSDAFGKVYSKLEQNEDAVEFEDTTHMTMDDVNITYKYDAYDFTIDADMDNDEYKLIVTTSNNSENSEDEDEENSERD